MRQKKRICRILTVLVAAALVLSLYPSSAHADSGTIMGDPETISVTNGSSKRGNNFNEGWKFYLGTSSTAQNPSFDDSGWKSVTLPYDFSISQGFTTSGEAESGFLPGGTGWYRKSFTMPDSDAGKTVLLNFDGVYSDAYVYVNGTLVGEHHYGYSSFAFDISEYLTCDGSTENVIAVKAVNNVPSSRWYSGSGIYRDVTLIVTDPIHVDLNGTYVTTPNISAGTGTVSVQADIVNDSNSSASVTVTNTVYRKGSEVELASANTTVTVSAGSTVTAAASPVVPNPALWSPEAPNLYTVVTTLTVDGTVVDTYETEFGFRYYSFDSSGFHLNGKNVKLNGVCLHHDQGALGSAAYYDAMYRQLALMKDMGCNAIRTSHNPADEDFINICNELGLLVIEELFDGWVEAKNSNSNDFAKYFSSSVGSSGPYGSTSSMTWAEFVTKSVVKRDRNDPSVILWSLGNEVQEGTNWTQVSSYASIAQNLINWIKSVDTTRPATSGDNNRGGNSNLVAVLNTILNNGGVVGFNYANTASSLYSLAQSYGGVIIASETSSATNSRGQYQNQNNNSNSDGNYHLTSYDTSAVGWGITAHDSLYNTYQYDCVAGEFVWTGFDYIGEPTPWNGTGSGSVSGSGAIPNSSYFGIVETTGFEKDTFYLYRSQWNKDETTLHLVTAWDSGNMMTSSSKTPVCIYSNAPVVKLYRDGALIGTATRTAHTSSAGHTYYTYSTTSNNSSVCTAVSASGSASLYATFNVSYTSGTISAKAFEADGTTEINLSGNSGKNSVTTPGTVSKLIVSQNRTEMDADGSSLLYIAVDVTDANGNLDTTATNTIHFSLTGNGEIVGVDNGDQATTAKYQQSSVLTSTTSAKIAAYAGKALVIVRSTKDAGTITVNVSSSGLAGGSVTVTTNVADDASDSDGLTQYTMVKDYTVKVGTVPTLQTTAEGLLSGGTTVNGSITWDEIPESAYGTAGDYTINGTLTFTGYDPIPVSCRLHVIANVIALRNISTATTPGTVPTLPGVVSGVLADGTLSGEFTVCWDAVAESQFAAIGNIVTVNGTATIFGEETLPVTCTVRVAEAVNSESSNVASSAALSEDCASTSDNLSSIVDGVTDNSADTNARWTNYNNRNTSSTATITFTWATAQLISSVNLYYFTDNYSASLPSSVAFSYSLDGNTYVDISYEDVTPSGGFTKTEYVFTKVINPVALRVTLTEQSGRCVGLTEAEVMTYAASLEYNSSADLSGITVDGAAVSGFSADTMIYTASGSTVAATTDVNAGITILPAHENVVRVLTISEDGSAAKTYAVTLSGTPACAHEHTEVRNAVAATCTTDGYTGDTYCTDCGEQISSGTVITAAGHSWSGWTVTNAATCTEDGTESRSCSVCHATESRGITATGHTWGEWTVTNAATCTEAGSESRTCSVCQISETNTLPATGHQYTEVRNAAAATCTTDGYTGDTYCTDCGERIASGTAIPAAGHQWNEGVVTKNPTETEPGIKTYTCTVCGATRTEEVEYVPQKTAPTVSLKVTAENGKLVMTGVFDDYENADKYYDVTAHGLVYIYSSKLGTRSLTVNTPGRTRVNFGAYKDDGSFIYRLTPKSGAIAYTVRAFLSYVDPDTGRTIYVYSDPIKVTYNGLIALMN